MCVARQGFDADVIVVGAGPSGLICAYEATLAGASVINLEKRNGPTWSRAGTIYPRVLELLRSRGLADRLLDRAREIQGKPESHSGVWAGMEPIKYGALDTPYPYVILMPQLETETVLAEALREIGGDIRLNHEVLGLEQDDDGVTVTVRTGEGAEQRLRARWVVGADGKQSVVRPAVGIAFDGHGMRRSAVNVDAKIDLPFGQPTNAFFNRAGWGMAYPLRQGLTRFVVIDAETMDDGAQTPPERDAALAMLRRVHGTDYDIQDIHQITRFGDAMLCADKLRAGRVFITGEAVRVHYPASGIGMQYCIMDAFNLGWKLGHVAAGHGPETLLDTFETERWPEIRRMLDMIDQQTAIQFRFDAETDALKRYFRERLFNLPAVNRVLAEDLCALSLRYDAPANAHPIHGLRLPPIPVQGAETSFDLAPDGRFLLLDLTGADVTGIPSPHPRSAVGSTAGPCVHPDLAGLGAVLVRPDGHVAWCSPAPLSGGVPAEALAPWFAH